jgi:hypothetical protein
MKERVPGADSEIGCVEADGARRKGRQRTPSRGVGSPVVSLALAALLALGGATAFVTAPAGTGPLPDQDQEVSLRPLPEGFSVEDRQEYGSFQDALRNGQLDVAERRGLELPPLMGRLVQGLRQALDGRTRGARATLESLAFDARDAGDEALGGLADAAGINLRFEAGDYDGVVAVVGADASDGLIAALAELPRQTLAPADPVSDLLRPGPGGQAALTVSVDGQVAEWWFDTGASFSVVSRGAAREWGVEISEAGPFDIATATSRRAEARVGVLGRLHVGAVEIRNLPVLVIADEDLTFELPGGGTTSLDGILGWTAIRSLRTELDFPGGRYSARLSEPAPGGVRNLGWLGYPVVRLADGSGQPLLFGLDTGSRNTSITRNILDKSDLGRVRRDTVRIAGVGGSVAEEAWIGESLTLALPTVLATIPEVQTETTSGADDILFFAADGVLGIDVAQRGVLTVDPPNGLLELRARQE